jgi:hypothetical protein
LSRLCNSKLKLEIILFDFEGRIIGKAPNEMIPFN